MGKHLAQLTDVTAALFAIGAGLYLLQYNAVSTGGGTSWFQIIGHGMGAYFIGKGLFMGRAAYISARSLDHLSYLAEWARYDHAAEIEGGAD